MNSRFLTATICLAAILATEFWLNRLDLAILILLVGVAITISQKPRRYR